VSFAPFQIKRYDLADYNFDLFSKFHVIAPHHNIAIALVILVFIVLTSTKHHAGIVAGLLSLLLGLIHPYIQLMMFLMLFANALIQTILERKLLTRAFRDFFIIIVISSPLIVYYLYLTNVILHFTVATDGILTFLPRTISFLSYLQALGPLFIFALPSLVFFIYSKPYSIIRFLLLWAFLPILLFFFPDFHLPFAVWRLSQIYQHIPLAILGAYWVYILIRNKRFALSLMILVGGITLLYGFTAYNYVFQASADTHDAGGYIFTYYVPTPVIHAFTYLDRETPRDSVVLASQMVSSMIPSFTHNRVIIGHNGNNRDYYQKLAEANMFFTGTMSYDDAHAYLLKRHVSYIIFGLDMPGFTAMSYANMGFLKLVYGNPYDISVVKVLR